MVLPSVCQGKSLKSEVMGYGRGELLGFYLQGVKLGDSNLVCVGHLILEEGAHVQHTLPVLYPNTYASYQLFTLLLMYPVTYVP